MTEIITPGDISTPESTQFYTPKEVAGLFRVDPKTVIRWEKKGLLAAHNIQMIKTLGGHRRYYKDDVDRMFWKLNPPKVASNEGT